MRFLPGMKLIIKKTWWKIVIRVKVINSAQIILKWYLFSIGLWEKEIIGKYLYHK